MRRLITAVYILLATLTVGIAVEHFAVRALTFVVEVESLPEVMPVELEQTQAQQVQLNGEVTVEFIETYQEADDKFAVYQVTNSSFETLYYMGYEHENNVNWMIKPEYGKIAQASAISCLHGLKGQRLLSGESVMFTIPVEEKPLRAGFDFWTADRRQMRTYWSERQIER